MAGLVVGVALIASLLLVHFSLRAQPMPSARPLDVDTGLPLPEVGQASTVFSLTALFGAYFGIYLLLGVPALLGLALGTAAGLLYIRWWILRLGSSSFERFLEAALTGTRENSAAFALALAGLQCAFATSELLILREIADIALGVRSDQATLLVVSLGIIAYFYVLFGGYVAVFRTDVLQFALVAAMAVIIFTLSPFQGLATSWTTRLLPRPGYWELPLPFPVSLVYGYHLFIGLVMGFGFLLASPDAWKRVFLVSATGRGRRRFVFFAAVGAAPFLLLIPMGAATNPIPDGPLNAAAMWGGVLSSNALFVATSLGLVASFLSSFNGAILLSVHVGLLFRRLRKRLSTELPRFHWLMVTALLTVFCLFAALRSLENPYFLANLLLGPYAVVAGIVVGSGGAIDRLRDGSLVWVIVLGCVCWLLYFVSRLGIPTVPTTYQLNTVPTGALLFALTAITCWALTIGGRGRARRN